MAEDPDSPPALDFLIDASGSSKQPQQLAALLDSALQREFPEALDIVEIAHAPNTTVVSLEASRSSRTIRRSGSRTVPGPSSMTS